MFKETENVTDENNLESGKDNDPHEAVEQKNDFGGLGWTDEGLAFRKIVDAETNKVSYKREEDYDLF